MKVQSNLPKPNAFFCVIPIIDIVLLIFIFFIPNSSFVLQSGIRVNLPKSDYLYSTAIKPTIITIKISKSYFQGEAYNLSTLYLNNKKISTSNLETALAKLPQHSEVLILADIWTPYGEIVRISNIIFKNELTLALGTIPNK